jgi:hypothetical protein
VVGTWPRSTVFQFYAAYHEDEVPGPLQGSETTQASGVIHSRSAGTRSVTIRLWPARPQAPVRFQSGIGDKLRSEAVNVERFPVAIT